MSRASDLRDGDRDGDAARTRDVRTSEDLLRQAERIARLGSFDWHLDTGALHWSDEHFRLLGFDPARDVPDVERFVARIHPDDRERQVGAVIAAIRDGRALDVEYRVHPRPDTTRILHSRGAVFTDASGRAVRFVGTVQDVTDQRLAEAALRAGERRLELAMQIARLGTWEWDIERDVLVWDAPASALYWGRAEAHETPASAGFEQIHPGDRGPMRRLLAQVLRHEGTYDAEYRVVSPAGEVRHLAARVTALRHADGRARCVIGTFLDATERVQREAALRVSDERFRRVAEQSRDLIGEIDADGRILYVSPNIERVLGWAPGEIIGRTMEELRVLLRSPSEPVQPHDLASLRRLGLADRIHDRKGRPHWIETSATIYDTAEGRRRVLVVARDITERMRLDEQLRQSQKLESLGLLAGGIAHDFGNLLVGILGNARLLLESVTDPAQRALLRDVERAGERAADLTRQLLAYAGRGKRSVETLDLSELAREMVELLRSNVPRLAVLEMRSAGAGPFVHADSSQLRQVVMNLITNAAEALGGAPGRVVVRVHRMHADRGLLSRCWGGDELPAGDYAAVEVHDTGCGMDDATLRRIFDPFFTTKFEGRGLGLAAVLGIARGHGGTIEVQSAPGAGTRFRVLLPCVDAPAARPGDGPSQPPRPDAGGGRAVLVVDDEDVVRRAVCRSVEAGGFAAIAAASGAQAVERVRSEGDAIRAVVLDATMPEMDGEATFAALRALRPDLPVVFVSGHGDAHLEESVRGKTRVSYVAKPFRPSELVERLHEVIARET